MPITLNSLRASSPGSPGVGGEKLVFFRPPTPLVVLCSKKGGRSPGQLGQEGYGKRKRKRQEVEFLKGREAEEIWGNYPTMLNISQSKKGENEEAKKTGAGDGRFGHPTPLPWFLNISLSK